MRIRVVIFTAGALIIFGLGILMGSGWFRARPPSDVTTSESIETHSPPENIANRAATAPAAPSKASDLRPTSAPTSAPAAPLVSADGAISLPVSAARITGYQLHLEHPAQPDLTYWVDPQEYPEWRHSVPSHGKYLVEITYACAPSAGGHYRIWAGGTFIESAATPTGGWDKYWTVTLPAPLNVSADWSTITIKCEGNPNHALMNLRGIRLMPVK